MAKKINEPLELPAELRAHFPALPEDATPSKKELRDRVIELHEAGEKEKAAELMQWQELRDVNKPLTKTQRNSRIAIVSMIVLIGIMGIFWFNYSSGNQNTKIVVCSINGQTFEGEACINPQPFNNENLNSSNTGNSSGETSSE